MYLKDYFLALTSIYLYRFKVTDSKIGLISEKIVAVNILSKSGNHLLCLFRMVSDFIDSLNFYSYISLIL